MDKTVIIGSMLASVSGHLVWILGLVNLAFLLVKGSALFSWAWVIGTAVVFVVSLGVVMGKFFKL